MEIIKTTSKLKGVIDLLRLEKELINSYVMFDKYTNELKELGITNVKSLSSSLSSSTIKEIIYKRKLVYKDTQIQHYKLIDNINDYQIESKN